MIMTRLMPAAALLFGSLTLAGCEQIEQAAAEAVEHARQSTAEVLDEAVRSGSLEQAKQKAREALQEAKQRAADMLGETSGYRDGDQPAQETDMPADGPRTTIL